MDDGNQQLKWYQIYAQVKAGDITREMIDSALADLTTMPEDRAALASLRISAVSNLKLRFACIFDERDGFKKAKENDIHRRVKRWQREGAPYGLSFTQWSIMQEKKL